MYVFAAVIPILIFLFIEDKYHKSTLKMERDKEIFYLEHSEIIKDLNKEFPEAIL